MIILCDVDVKWVLNCMSILVTVISRWWDGTQYCIVWGT
jgi:hypothetical protein